MDASCTPLILPKDVLVSNAGICPFDDFVTMDVETWHRTRSVNLDGAFYITQGTPQSLCSENLSFDFACSCRAPDERTDAARGLNHWYIINICPSRWWTTSVRYISASIFPQILMFL
jgi:NAD(P)-dependent dehydrogenase (short-subunit alcohol dehydrogenase family)